MMILWGTPMTQGIHHILENMWRKWIIMNLWDEGKKHLAARLGTMNMTISIREWDECGDLAMQVTLFWGGGTQSKMCHEFEVIFWLCWMMSNSLPFFFGTGLIFFLFSKKLLRENDHWVPLASALSQRLIAIDRMAPSDSVRRSN